MEVKSRINSKDEVLKRNEASHNTCGEFVGFKPRIVGSGGSDQSGRKSLGATYQGDERRSVVAVKVGNELRRRKEGESILKNVSVARVPKSPIIGVVTAVFALVCRARFQCE